MTDPESINLPVVVSIGDPAGIGPEIIAACWRERHAHNLPPFFVVGDRSTLRDAGADQLVEIHTAEAAQDAFTQALPVMPVKAQQRFEPGQPSLGAASLALAALEQATALAIAGKASALVTAPVAKSWLAQVGFDHPGQTEYVAQRCGIAAQDAVMMLAGDYLKVVPLTVHIALADVPATITTGLICNRARIVAKSLIRDFGIAQPRLAIAALNPHAGENGRFGDEDDRIVAPAIRQLQAEGIVVTGPHPADTLFHAEARQRYDVALAMYHDQALIPIKTLDFDNGVNITLGLPIIRTSPDHGTAFDIAGKGLARPDSMAAAIRLAAACAARRSA